MSNLSKRSLAAGTAPDGIERLRKAKRALAAFDAVLAASDTPVVRAMSVGPAPGGPQTELPPGSWEPVGQAVRRVAERHLAALLGDARDLLVAEVEAAKAAAREEYERELATHH